MLDNGNASDLANDRVNSFDVQTGHVCGVHYHGSDENARQASSNSAVVVPPARLELATRDLRRTCSIQLSYEGTTQRTPGSGKLPGVPISTHRSQMLKRVWGVFRCELLFVVALTDIGQRSICLQARKNRTNCVFSNLRHPLPN